jgi:hypothetical protein
MVKARLRRCQTARHKSDFFLLLTNAAFYKVRIRIASRSRSGCAMDAYANEPYVKRRKLPVFATVGRAYAATLRSFPTLLRISWLWVLAIALVGALFGWVGRSILPPHASPADIARFTTMDMIAFQGFNTLAALAVLPFLSSIAVNWHRYLLLGERPAATAFARLDGTVWSYTVALAVLTLLRTAIAVVQQVGLPAGDGGPPAGSAVIVQLALTVLSVAAFMYIGRYSLALPARALEHGWVSFSDAFTTTQGNTWRLAWGFIFSMIFYIAIIATYMFVWPGMTAMLAGDLSSVVLNAGFVIVTTLAAMVSVSFLSFAYEHFFRTQPAAR